MSPTTAEFTLSERPDRLIMPIRRLKSAKARQISLDAVAEARRMMPKLTGHSSSRLYPIWGWGYAGVGWVDPWTWYQEHGIRPFTMTALQGKTIPMWVDDPTGVERSKNPKAKIRTTLSGKTQVLIFRRAAMVGQTKTVRSRSKVTGVITTRQVPMSWPGAPGRIGVRQIGQPWTSPGKVGGQVATGNVGVRWRHPGLAPRQFINSALTLAAQRNGILPIRIYVADVGWRGHF